MERGGWVETPSPEAFRGARSRPARGRETAEELRFHLEMEAEQNRRAGMDPGEARRRARLRLGGIDGIMPPIPGGDVWIPMTLASQVMPGITPADPVVWGGALLLIAGVAAAAHFGPVRRAVRLDLTQALHVE